jgi:predicted enzyme related to lactoylglutathione lyase
VRERGYGGLGREEEMDRVEHFEIPVDDAARAREFYGSVFEWELNEADMGGGNMYTTVTTTPIDESTRLPTEPGAINGGLMQRTADTPAPVITIAVTSIDESLKKVEAGGGSTVQPRTEIPDMGAFAYFKDSENNVVGLWENF